MADPLSISGSIAAVVQVSVAVLRYLGDVKDASAHTNRLRNEIDSLQRILRPVLQRLEQSGNSIFTRQLIEAQSGPLDELHILLEDLQRRLAPVAGFRKIRKAVIWPFEKRDIIEIVGAIERQKTLFMMTLSIGQSEMLQESHLQRGDAFNDFNPMIDKREVMDMSRNAQPEEVAPPVRHNGNNYGACNVLYGGTQDLSGSTMYFG